MIIDIGLSMLRRSRNWDPQHQGYILVNPYLTRKILTIEKEKTTTMLLPTYDGKNVSLSFIMTF